MLNPIHARKGSVLIFILGLFALTSCAPQNRYIHDSSSTLAALTNLSDLESAAGGSYNCTSGYNITLADGVGSNGYNYSGGESYKVCRSTTNSSEFSITATSSHAVCVFPMYSGYSSTSGQSLMAQDLPQCFNVGTTALKMSFEPGVMINYMIVVDYDYAVAMNTCLQASASGDSSTCPPHAKGFVQ